MGLFKSLRSIMKSQPKPAPIEEKSEFAPVIEFMNASASYYKSPIAALSTDLIKCLPTRSNYDLPDNQLLAKYSRFREGRMKLHKYAATEIPCELRPEPSNKYDKNAIAIYAKAPSAKKWHQIGYFFSEDTDKVRELLALGYQPRITVTGGQTKYSNLMENGHHEVITEEHPFAFNIELFKTPTTD
jgi:hypothetical protein